MIAGDPPLASSETLYSHSMVNIDRGFQMMTWEQFSQLDPECKSAEIQRLLPLVGFMTEDISSIQKDVTMVENRLQEIRCGELMETWCYSLFIFRCDSICTNGSVSHKSLLKW